MNSPIIEVKNLTKQFEVHKKKAGLLGSLKSVFNREYITKTALNNVSFKIEPGEIVGLIGANGAGKTTLVKSLSGIIFPSSGTANVMGYTPWERKKDFRSQIALIMGQKAQLWWDLPAADCFLLLREIYSLPEKQFQENLNYLSEILEVKNQLNIQIRKLSLGERMKMELMAALLHQPKVVFLDEPTIGLDISAQRAVRKFLLDYRRKHQPAMILTSHYMEDIESLCERILIMREGSLIYDGSLKGLQNKFSMTKVIQAQLPDQIMKVSVPKDQVATKAAELLRTHPVVDLSIEEEDISTLIEKIMKQGIQSA